MSAGDAAAVRAFLAAGWRHDHRDDGDWTPLLLAALNLVPLRGLLVGAGMRVPPAARIGVGAEWLTERVVALDGGQLTVLRRDSVVEIGDVGYTIDSTESVLVPGLAQRDGRLEMLMSLRQETVYRTTVMPYDRWSVVSQHGARLPSASSRGGRR